MTEIKTQNWGGKRKGAGRKAKRDGLKKMEVYLSPEIKNKAADKAKSLGISQSEYIKNIILKDLES